MVVSSTHPTISSQHRMCDGSIADPKGFDNQHTAQALTRSTAVAAAGVSHRANPHSTQSISLSKLLFPGSTLDCSVQRAILPDPEPNFWSRQVGAGGGCTQRSNTNRRPNPEFQGTACYFRIHAYQHFQCLTMPSRLFAKALPTDGALRSLLSGVVSRPSPMQLPANASSTQGQCGKLTPLPLRASANTNTMTTAPNRSFSSSQVFRETDTGQAFAPSRPPPPTPFKSRLIQQRPPTLNLTAILVRLLALSAQAIRAR